MCEISFVIFLISALVYVGIMIHDPRTLWSSFHFWMLALFAMFLFFTVSQYSEQLASHDWIVGILIALFVAAVGCVLAFPVLLIIMFFVEGIKLLRHEESSRPIYCRCSLPSFCTHTWQSGPESEI